MKRWVLATLLAAMVAGLGGCIAIGSSTQNRPTTGQELTDLKTALDRGAINQQEYEQQKVRILSERK